MQKIVEDKLAETMYKMQDSRIRGKAVPSGGSEAGGRGEGV